MKCFVILILLFSYSVAELSNNEETSISISLLGVESYQNGYKHFKIALKDLENLVNRRTLRVNISDTQGYLSKRDRDYTFNNEFKLNNADNVQHGHMIKVPFKLPRQFKESIMTITVTENGKVVGNRQIYIRPKVNLIYEIQSINSAACSDDYQFWKWSARVKDNGKFGLKTIDTVPVNRYRGENFIIGTYNAVDIEQEIPCSVSSANVTVTDLMENSISFIVMKDQVLPTQTKWIDRYNEDPQSSGAGVATIMSKFLVGSVFLFHVIIKQVVIQRDC